MGFRVEFVAIFSVSASWATVIAVPVSIGGTTSENIAAFFRLVGGIFLGDERAGLSFRGKSSVPVAEAIYPLLCLRGGQVCGPVLFPEVVELTEELCQQAGIVCR